MAQAFSRLDELLSDPLVQLVMARDHVQPEELRRMLERVRQSADLPNALPAAHIIAACRSKPLCL